MQDIRNLYHWKDLMNLFQWSQSFGDHQYHFEPHTLSIYLYFGVDYTGILIVQ